MKDIKGWEGKYSITREGKIWCHPRIIIQKSPWGGLIKRHWKGHWMKSNTTKNGKWYYSIALGNKKSGNRKGYKIHRLIAEAYIPNPLNLPEVNHKNGNKGDNRIKNLEWCDHQQNITHSWENGFSKPVPHKLTEKQVLFIRKKYGNKRTSYKKIGRNFKVSSSTVGEILRRESWNHI